MSDARDEHHPYHRELARLQEENARLWAVVEMQCDIFGDLARLAQEHAPYEEIGFRATIMASRAGAASAVEVN